jgi:N-acetylmuramoyl-L-alanine amidase
MQSQYQKGGRAVRPVKRQLLKVLYATDMPSVLTELGFMTNKSELAYMNSEKGQNAYARMLCNAVKEYVGHINRLAGVTTEMVESSEPEVQEVEQPKSKEESKVEPKSVPAEEKNVEKAAVKEGYTIQLLASDKRVKTSDSQFKSYRGKVACYEGGGKLKYKYCYGNFSTRAEAQRKLSEVRRSFKDAFVVHYNGDKIVK